MLCVVVRHAVVVVGLRRSVVGAMDRRQCDPPVSVMVLGLLGDTV